MNYIFLVYFFILGLIVGSFLNVVIYRYNTGKTIGGRSGCMSCGKKLKAFELVPVFSYLFLRGKCSGCGARISSQYPLVELASGLLFLALATKVFDSNPTFSPEQASLYGASILHSTFYILFATIFSILVVIFVYDIKHKIIPDGLVFAFAILALIYQLLNLDYSNINLSFWLNIFSGIIFFIPFAALWLFSQGRWIGLGDGKLVLGIGWMLGFVHGLSAIILSFWLGAIVSIAIMLTFQLKGRGQNITMKTEIPFAPFLIIGFLIVFFYPIDVFNLSLLFNL
ncbi:prepilin peptidase [Candidatus Nomurabacteria bacterium]|nr:prepilin peptidase [Candidatus Nomurabacteria bacterium]